MSRHIREELRNALNHRSSSVRERAVEALAQDSTEEGFELLLGMTRDRGALVRMRAAESLGSGRDARAVGILRMLLREADWGVRLNTVKALGRLPARNAAADPVRVV